MKRDLGELEWKPCVHVRDSDLDDTPSVYLLPQGISRSVGR